MHCLLYFTLLYLPYGENLVKIGSVDPDIALLKLFKKEKMTQSIPRWLNDPRTATPVFFSVMNFFQFTRPRTCCKKR